MALQMWCAYAAAVIPFSLHLALAIRRVAQNASLGIRVPDKFIEDGGQTSRCGPRDRNIISTGVNKASGNRGM